MTPCRSMPIRPYAAASYTHVGTPRYRIPTEPDLAAIFEAAEQAGVAWLMFDREAAVIEGLPAFDALPPAT